jgi:hypothetical protein
MYNSPDPHRRPAPHHRPAPPPPPYVAPTPAPSYPARAAITQSTPIATDGRARVAGIALLVATGLLLVAALTKSWFTAGGDSGVGLLGLEKCRGLVCQSATWFDMTRIPTQIPIFATTALIASLVAVALLVHAGVMLVQNRPEAVKLTWVSQLLGLTSFGIVAFVFSLSFGEWSRGLSIGWSAFVGIGGLIAAAVVTATMVRPLTTRGS